MYFSNHSKKKTTISLICHVLLIYYSTEIFKTAGLSAQRAEYATIATGGVNVIMTLVSAFLMDRVGRRTLLLLGVGGLLIFSAVLALSLILIK